MKLTRVDGSCNSGDCPTVYRTDRGTIAIQGWLLAGEVDLILPEGEGLIEIPTELLLGAARVVGR
jgi:hypothetical protein